MTSMIMAILSDFFIILCRYPISIHFSIHMRADIKVPTPFDQSGRTPTAKFAYSLERVAYQRDAVASPERTSIVRKPTTSRCTQAGAGRQPGAPDPVTLSVAATQPDHTKGHGSKDHQKVGFVDHDYKYSLTLYLHGDSVLTKLNRG